MPLNSLIYLRKCGFPKRPHFIHGELLFPFLHIGSKGLVLQHGFRGNFHKAYVRYRELHPVSLFLVILEHVDVLRYAFFVTIIGEHLGGEDEDVDHVETSATQLVVVH